MKIAKKEIYKGFEQGVIRPPSEATSLLIRITRNCPWNLCLFCPVYKKKKFSIRPLEHIIKDIDTVKFHVENIKNKYINKTESKNTLSNYQKENIELTYAAYNFINGGMKSVFLQDGDSLIIKPKNIIKILKHIKISFPEVKRITTYARSNTISKININDLKAFYNEGLNRIHIGMESGSNTILKLMRKGVNQNTQIIAGQKVKEANIQLSEYYMPGLGGKYLYEENAIETAKTINKINPDFIRLRTLAVRRSSPLENQIKEKKFIKSGEITNIKEILIFIKNLDNINTKIRSDHMLNLLNEVHGTMPNDKEKIIKNINKFLNLDKTKQMIFCIGKRLNKINKIDDLNNSSKYQEIKNICHKLKITNKNMNEKIESIFQHFL